MTPSQKSSLLPPSRVNTTARSRRDSVWMSGPTQWKNWSASTDHDGGGLVASHRCSASKAALSGFSTKNALSTPRSASGSRRARPRIAVVHRPRRSNRCIPSGHTSPACSASVQPVLALQTGHQPGQVLPRPTPRLGPSEPARDPHRHPIQLRHNKISHHTKHDPLRANTSAVAVLSLDSPLGVGGDHLRVGVDGC